MNDHYAPVPDLGDAEIIERRKQWERENPNWEAEQYRHSPLSDLTYCPTCRLAMFTRDNVLCAQRAALVSRDSDGTAVIQLTGGIVFDEGDAALGCVDESHTWAMDCIIEDKR